MIKNWIKILLIWIIKLRGPNTVNCDFWHGFYFIYYRKTDVPINFKLYKYVNQCLNYRKKIFFFFLAAMFFFCSCSKMASFWNFPCLVDSKSAKRRHLDQKTKQILEIYITGYRSTYGILKILIRKKMAAVWKKKFFFRVKFCT